MRDDSSSIKYFFILSLCFCFFPTYYTWWCFQLNWADESNRAMSITGRVFIVHSEIILFSIVFVEWCYWSGETILVVSRRCIVRYTQFVGTILWKFIALQIFWPKVVEWLHHLLTFASTDAERSTWWNWIVENSWWNWIENQFTISLSRHFWTRYTHHVTTMLMNIETYCKVVHILNRGTS